MIKRVDYLDKGFVELLDVFGNDTMIALAARASYLEEEYKDPARNAGLVRYMVEHNHGSPLEMPAMFFRIKMPIFVMRQHVRHRIASLNEQSMRYSNSDGDYYLPEAVRVKGQHETNHQGSGETLSQGVVIGALEIIENSLESQYKDYLRLIEAGVARELSRIVLGTSFYTTIVWKINIRSMFNYLSLRADSHAQEEIQVLARIIGDMVEEHFPETYAAWVEFQRDAVTFSATELQSLRKLLSIVDFSNDNLTNVLPTTILGSQRRAEEFLVKLFGEVDVATT